MSTIEVVNTIIPTSETALNPLPPLWWAVQNLKSERVQEGLTARLTSRQAAGVMPLLPGWRLVAKGKAIERCRQFATQEVAASYAAFVAGFAGTLGIPAAVSIKGTEAVVLLHSVRSRRRMGALSEGILGFAKLLG